MKKCIGCDEVKPLDEYYERWQDERKLVRIKMPRCKACCRKRVYEERNPVKARENRYRKKYGIGIEEYEALLANQGGVCGICGLDRSVKKLAVDHDHQRQGSGGVRGLLCARCNTAIGKLGDDATSVKRAYDYLLRYEMRGPKLL